MDECKALVAGVTQFMVVQTRDAFNNDGSFDSYAAPLILGASLLGTSGTAAAASDGQVELANADVPLSVQNLLNGIYRVSYTATRSGGYALAVSVDGAVIGMAVQVNGIYIRLESTYGFSA